MEKLKSSILLLTIVITLISLLSILNPEQRKKSIFHNICSIFVLYIFLSSLFEIDCDNILDFNIKNYENKINNTLDIRSEILERTSDQVENELKTLLTENNIVYDSIDVSLHEENKTINIERIEITNCSNKYKSTYLIKNHFKGDVNIDYR